MTSAGTGTPEVACAVPAACFAEGGTMPGINSTANKLNMFEPMTLPITMSGSFFKALVIEAANSGRLVPTAITVSPMTTSETFM